MVAVPEPARAFAVAGLAEASGRRPTVVAVPTNSEAERLAHDLAAFLGADEVDVFPAWETLPFERVSPSVETMGRRLRTMWRLPARPGRATPGALPKSGGAGPGVAAAPRSARRGRRPGGGRHGRPGRPGGAHRAAGRRWATGGSTRSSTAASWRCGAGIVDVFPSTADVPVRIDLWGDEVDRLTEF